MFQERSMFLVRSAIAKGLILYVAVPYFKLALGLILLSVAPFYLLFAAIERIHRLFKPSYAVAFPLPREEPDP